MGVKNKMNLEDVSLVILILAVLGFGAICVLDFGLIPIGEEKQISGYTIDVDYISGGIGQNSMTIVTFDKGEVIIFRGIEEIPEKQHISIIYKDTLYKSKQFISCEVIQ